MEQSFEEYLIEELSSPKGEHYNPSGNSSCAVVTRMRESVFKAFFWECKEVFTDVKYTITQDFRGYETSIGWFVQILLLPILILIVPFGRTYTRYQRAIKDYRSEYDSGK